MITKIWRWEDREGIYGVDGWIGLTKRWGFLGWRCGFGWFCLAEERARVCASRAPFSHLFRNGEGKHIYSGEEERAHGVWRRGS